MTHTAVKNLAYYKANAEEDYLQVPISVLRYISQLEQEISYSEEEVSEIIAEAWNSCEDNEGETFTEVRKRILEQFKKK